MDEMFENWGETKAALLEGLDSSKQKIVAPLLENQKNHLLSEAAASGSTGAHDIAGFRKILIPMIRRIIPGTIASELVGVQPMSGPVGLVYSLRYKYNQSVTDGTVDNAFGLQDIVENDEAFGNDPVLRAFYSGGTGADQLAGAGGIAGSVDIGDAAVIIKDGATEIDGTTSTGEAWGSSLDFSGSNVVGHDVHGGSGGNIEGSGGRKMGLEIVSQAVEAGTRKLQAGWTIEAMQDMNSQHGLDIESEMTQALSAEIVQEIDAEIINDLIALAGTTDTFDGAGGGVYGTNYTPTYIGDRLANLGVLINRVANEIGRKTRRGVGNFIVVSPMIVSVLQSAAKSVFAPAVDGSFKGPNNTMLVGTLNGNIKVYSYLWNQAGDIAGGLGNAVTPANVADTILVGYKGGNGETDTGYFYCPYIPLMSSGVVVNPVTFQPVVSLMTRYGKTSFTDANTSLGNSADYYGKIAVVGLDLL